MHDVWNNEIVKNINRKLKEIDESLSIGRASGTSDKIYSVGFSIPLKGNANLIKKIERLGFYRERKEKRHDSFYQIMTYDIHYDKYAIYQGTFGLYAMLYIDNIFDFKRHGVLGNPYTIEFPIVVNKNGGHHTFHEKYEKNFLEIKEVLEDEEPLTREEMFPKNNDNFFYGWIDRMGNTYSCSFESHASAAEAICEEQNIKNIYPERALEELGWLKISRKAPYTPDNINSRTVYLSTTNLRLTKPQIEKIYELGLEKDRNISWLLEEDFEEDFEKG